MTADKDPADKLLTAVVKKSVDLQSGIDSATGRRKRAFKLQLHKLEKTVSSVAKHPHLEFLKLIFDVKENKTARTLHDGDDVIGFVIPSETLDKLFDVLENVGIDFSQTDPDIPKSERVLDLLEQL